MKGLVSWKGAVAIAVPLVAWPLQATAYGGNGFPVPLQSFANQETDDCWSGTTSWLPGTIQTLKAVPYGGDGKTLLSGEVGNEEGCAFA